MIPHSCMAPVFSYELPVKFVTLSTLLTIRRTVSRILGEIDAPDKFIEPII